MSNTGQKKPQTGDNQTQEDSPVAEGGERHTPTPPNRNRDVVLLSQVLYVMQEIKAIEQKRMWLQDRLWHISQNLTGVPGGHGMPQGFDAQFVTICEVEEQYREELTEFLRILQDAENVMKLLPDHISKTFVEMKYMLGMSRKEIMLQLGMRRWQYDKLSARIEQAEDMAHVVWPTKRLDTTQKSDFSK